MKSQMLKDFETRYTGVRVKELLLIASLLDPRNKNNLMNISSADILIQKAISVVQSKSEYNNANTQAEVIHCTEDQQYEPLSNFNEVSGLTEASTSSSTESTPILTSTDLMISLFDDPVPDTYSVNPSHDVLEEEISYEVKHYLKYKIDGVKNKSFDILKWWKDNNDMFPNLSILAKQYLCIPASSTSSERCFSIANNIVTKSRNRLLPENVEMLTFLKNNFEYIPLDTHVKDIDNKCVLNV